jgi:hypothetical protein
MTGRFLKLQQATRVAEQHLARVGQCDIARCPPEQGPFGLELKPLDLLLTVDCVRLSRSAARWKPPQSATATKARKNSEFSMQLILFRDQSYYEKSFL